MRFMRRLICTLLFVPVLLLDVALLGWMRWLFTGKSNDLVIVQALQDWADQ